MSGLLEIAAELYGAPLDRFTVERASAASVIDDRTLRMSVLALRKPTLSAWAINMLAREEPGLLAELIAVGAALRDATRTLDRHAMRELSTRRQRTVGQVTKRAVELSPGAGASVQREIQDTLQAAVIDEMVAAAVLSGCLVRALVSTGVDRASVVDAVGVPLALGEDALGADALEPQSTAGTLGERAAHDAAAADLERERRRAEATARVDSARAAVASTQELLDDETDRRTHLEAERRALAQQLSETEDALLQARESERELRHRLGGLSAELASAERTIAAMHDR